MNLLSIRVEIWNKDTMNFEKNFTEIINLLKKKIFNLKILISCTEKGYNYQSRNSNSNIKTNRKNSRNMNNNQVNGEVKQISYSTKHKDMK